MSYVYRALFSFAEQFHTIQVLGKRKTVFGTAWYELNHSSIDVTRERFHVAVWFGVCSYRKMKLSPEKRKELCPLCQEELEDVVYCGSRRITDVRSHDFHYKGLADFEEDGCVVWIRKGNGG